MANHKKNWLAVVIAYRKEETDLAATVESAELSAGAGAQIITVEDKDATGPGWNRHRGIEAAKDAEVIIIVDAHMRFKGDVLRRMGAQVKKSGGLLVPFCHHNAECSFDTKTATGKHYYGGARIVYRAQDGGSKTALAAKWARVAKAGPVAAVMGACYAFRRDWYYKVGQPLSILRGWGCDEEVLSIAAWLSGTMPEVIYGHVAHLYRARAPWGITEADIAAVHLNRRTMLSAFVSDASDRAELMRWQSGIGTFNGMEVERLRQALLKLPRKWREWMKEVCEADEIDGKQEPKPKQVKDHPITAATRHAPVAARVGITCPHCKCVSESHAITNTYPNGNKRHRCESCGNPFVSVLVARA